MNKAFRKIFWDYVNISLYFLQWLMSVFLNNLACKNYDSSDFVIYFILIYWNCTKDQLTLLPDLVFVWWFVSTWSFGYLFLFKEYNPELLFILLITFFWEAKRPSCLLLCLFHMLLSYFEYFLSFWYSEVFQIDFVLFSTLVMSSSMTSSVIL